MQVLGAVAASVSCCAQGPQTEHDPGVLQLFLMFENEMNKLDDAGARASIPAVPRAAQRDTSLIRLGFRRPGTSTPVNGTKLS